MPDTQKKQQPGLPIPVPKSNVSQQNEKKPIISEKKLAAAKDLISGIRDIAGVAGDVGLRSFTEGMGIDFKISNNNIISEIRPKGDKGFYIDGKPVADPETTELLRGVLKAEFESQGKKKKQ